MTFDTVCLLRLPRRFSSPQVLDRSGSEEPFKTFIVPFEISGLVEGLGGL